MRARERVHREREVRLQVLLQRLVQVAELLGAARDFLNVAREGDEVCAFEDLKRK